MKPKTVVPKCKTEAAELTFWARHDSTAFVDYRKGRRALFPNLRPSVKTISIRVPEALLESLKTLAHKQDVPYQSLVKIILAERVAEALHTSKQPSPPSAACLPPVIHLQASLL